MDFIRLFDCINVWQRVSGLCPDPWGAREKEGKRRIDGERERERERGGPRLGPPKIYDRSPPLPGTTWLRTVADDLQALNFGGHTAWR